MTMVLTLEMMRWWDCRWKKSVTRWIPMSSSNATFQAEFKHYAMPSEKLLVRVTKTWSADRWNPSSSFVEESSPYKSMPWNGIFDMTKLKPEAIFTSMKWQSSICSSNTVASQPNSLKMWSCRFREIFQGSQRQEHWLCVLANEVMVQQNTTMHTMAKTLEKDVTIGFLSGKKTGIQKCGWIATMRTSMTTTGMKPKTMVGGMAMKKNSGMVPRMTLGNMSNNNRMKQEFPHPIPWTRLHLTLRFKKNSTRARARIPMLWDLDVTPVAANGTQQSLALSTLAARVIRLTMEESPLERTMARVRAMENQWDMAKEKDMEKGHGFLVALAKAKALASMEEKENIDTSVTSTSAMDPKDPWTFPMSRQSSQVKHHPQHQELHLPPRIIDLMLEMICFPETRATTTKLPTLMKARLKRAVTRYSALRCSLVVLEIASHTTPSEVRNVEDCWLILERHQGSSDQRLFVTSWNIAFLKKDIRMMWRGLLELRQWLASQESQTRR